MSSEPSAPRKRSLFNKPAWSQFQSEPPPAKVDTPEAGPVDESAQALEFFSRATDNYPDFLAEEQRRLYKKAEKRKQKRDGQGDEVRGGKRPRLSEDGEESGGDSGQTRCASFRLAETRRKGADDES